MAPTPGLFTGSGPFTTPEETELKYPKVGSILDDLIARVEAGEISAEDAAGEAPLHRGESVAVRVYLSGNVDGVLRFLQDNGVSPRHVGEDYIVAFIPILLLPQTSEQPGVLRVEESIPGKSFQSATRITGNGPAAHGSPAWNQAGYRGQGIKVGIIDDGFEGFSGLMGTELPQSVEARCYPIGSDTPTNEIADCDWDAVHGTAVAESVMDIAPEVSLYIANVDTPDDVQAAVEWMIDQEVHVINHSMGWPFDGPGDGTSQYTWGTLRSVDRAVEEGIVWVNSAGNEGGAAWFKRNPSYATMTISGEDVRVILFYEDYVGTGFHAGSLLQLRWEDSWQSAASDLALFIIEDPVGNPNSGTWVNNRQQGNNGDIPRELFAGEGIDAVFIAHLGGEEPDWVQLVSWEPFGLGGLPTDISSSGSISNPAESANPGMLTVGAAPWDDVDSIEDFSSRGPTPDGRIKPDMVGADCGDTAAYGDEHFCGTSQASPHVAGMAALVRQRFPDYSPEQVVSYLKDNAQQGINNPDPNNTWGHGFIVLPSISTDVASISDLVVDTPTVDTSAPAAGTSFTLNATVRNRGNGASVSTTLRYFLSTDSTITTGDTEVDTDSVSSLDASGSGASSISLTAPSIPDTYYYGACVDAVSDESDTTNNCSLSVAVTVGAAPAPDLVVDAPTVDTSAPAAGTSFTLNAAVRNQGSGASVSTTLRYFLSTDSTITTGDTQVSADSVSPLDASGSGDVSISLTAPDAPGTYYYGACVDSVSEESDTTNNCSTAVTVTVGAAPAPDLVVDTPRVSESAPIVEAPFTLNATVRNLGSGRSDSTTLRYYQSTDSTITTDDTVVGTDSVYPLDASGSGNQSVSLDAPSTPGTYYYGACVDSVSDEFDATNNCSPAVTVTVGPAPDPDLVVDTPTVSESAPIVEAPFTLSATVRNQGSGASVSTTLRYYQSTDSTITISDTEVGTDSVSRLDASESGDESISLDAPSTPGAYYYGACVDAVSDESDTTNNCSLSVAVTVGAAPAPDLVVDAPTVDTGAPVAGARFTLSATLRNQGNGPSGFTTLRYYQSTDSTITTSDTEVGTDSVSGLDASESGDESISLDAPSAPGTYYYGTCVDSVSDESDTTNNCSTAVTVTVSAAPGKPANQRYSWQGTTTVVSWDPSAGADNYKVYHDDFFNNNCSLSFLGTPRFCEELAENVVGTTYTHTSPHDDRNYYWITACNSAGCSAIDSRNPARMEGSTPAPDLVVDTPTVSESAPTAGASFTLNATVRNQGSGASAFTTLRYYQSSDSTITTGDTEVDTGSVSSLDASESGDASVTLTAPSATGTYYYGACMDSVSGESDTQNNCSSAVTVTVGAAPAPDLVVDTPTVSESAPTAGARFTLSATVRNQGSGRSDSTTLRYYRSTDSTITTGDTEFGTDSVSGLNPSSVSPESISLTAPATPGTYYYGACVDAVSDESDTTNNCSPAVTVTVGAAPAPDLVVDTPTVSESTPVAGVSISLSATVRNQGNGSSAFTTLRYYQSSDSTITAGDTEVGTDSVSRLDPSESGDESISLTAPSTPGTYYYGACVDAVSDESNTTNNCSSVVTVTVGAAPAPDLVVSQPNLGGSVPIAGESFLLNATVDNQGSAPSARTTLRFYLSTDTTIPTGDAVVGTASVVPLGAPGGYVTNISLTAPSTPGTYYYGACVDAVSGESDTTNNCSAAAMVTVGAAPAPDLVVDRPTVSDSAPAAGASFTLNATVRNQGNGSSSFTTLRYYQSTDSTITTGDTEVGTDSVFSLDAAESGDESTSVTAPDTPGTYYYGACVDAVSGESDTTNNCSAAAMVTVGAAPAPDLVVDRPTVSDSAPDAGSSFTLNATVRNQGNGSSSFTTLRYYRSTDSTITASDTAVGTDPVSGLSASGTNPQSINQTAPDTPGTYYYGACVDAVSGESDTTNNCSVALTVTVGAAPTPDLVVNTPTVSDSSPTAGASFTLSATVRNQGNGSAGFTTLRYYRSSDSTITASDTAVGTDPVSGLSASGTSPESTSPTAPSTPGTYYYGACVDAVSGESDTTNNCSAAAMVTVGAAPAPDLVVDRPTVSDSSPTTGVSFTLNATVRNQGSGSADSTTLRYYRSSDSTITTSDTEIGTDSVSRLDASGSGDESVSLTAPSTPGTYYYGACVDVVSGESDTTNNCSPAVTVTVGAAVADSIDYDSNSNGLIEISNLEQLNAIRWDLNGDGVVEKSANISTYTAAFPNAAENMGCSSSGCMGYELTRDLDFNSAASYASGSVKENWRTSTGWEPIGGLRALNSGSQTSFNTEFDGNGHTISNLYIDYSDQSDDNYLGLFGRTRSESVIHGIGLVAVDVSGRWHIGGLVGYNDGAISDSYATGEVSGRSQDVGGLVGSNAGAISTSHAAVNVSGDNKGNFGGLVGSNTGIISSSYATGRVSNANTAGGLVGINWNGAIATSYATGEVSGWYNVGGLVGANLGNRGPSSSAIISASYATGNVSASWRYAGGLVGTNSSSSGSSAIISASYSTGTVSAGAGVGGLVGNNGGTIYTSYWDTSTSGRAVGVGTDDVDNDNVLDADETATPGAIGKTTTELRTPRSYTGIYASWNIDLDGDGRIDDPWEFGTSTEYPTLNVVSLTRVVPPPPPVTATAPGAPTGLTATANGQTEIDLSWSAPSDDGGAAITGYKIEVSTNGSSWSDLEANTGSSSISYTHTGLTSGSTRHYRVSAINSAGTGPASNTDSATTEAAPAPDLVVDTPTVDDSSPTSGESFTLSATVRNQGDGSSGSTTLRYYRSSDSTITSGDTEVGTDSVSKLDASESGDESISLTAPSTPGTYYYGACVDSVSGESDTGNNCSSAVSLTVAAQQSVPGSPANAQYRRDGTTTVVTWDPSPEATHYKIYYDDFFDSNCRLSFGRPSFCELLDGNVTGTTYTHTDPDDDDNYYWVTACNEAGCSDIDSDNPAQFVDNRPSAPTNVRVSRESSSLKVSWNAVSSATHYKVYYSDFFDSNCHLTTFGQPSFCEELAADVPGPAYTHAGQSILSPKSPSIKVVDRTSDSLTAKWFDRNEINYYWVTACNSAGCSDIANSSSASFRLGTQYYQLSRSLSREGGYTLLESRLTGSSLVDQDLQPSTIYYYRIVGCNDDGCSDPSQTGGLTESDGTVDIPSTPTGVQGDKVRRLFWPDDARVSWNMVEGATYYKVYQGSKLEVEVSAPQVSYYDGSPNRFLGAFSSTSYKVQACNKAGCSPFSESVTVH